MASSESPNILPESTLSAAPATCSVSSSWIVAWNDDILILILFHLPIKSLLKVKLVCNHWRSLISDPVFCHRRTAIGRRTPSGLLLMHSMGYSNGRYDFINLKRDFPCRPPLRSISMPNQRSSKLHITRSCNGLMICQGHQYHSGIKRYNYYVYNPTTKKYTKLPDPGGDSATRSIYGLFLAFDPSKSPHYKVICVRSFHSLYGIYQIHIYSSQTGNWTQSRGPFSAPRSVMQRGAYWNGAIHWISDWGSSVYFDVNEERVREMPMPEMIYPSMYRDVEYFEDSGEHLQLVGYYKPFIKHVIVYEMKEDRSGWFVKYMVELDARSFEYPGMPVWYFSPWIAFMYRLTVLCIVEDEVEDEWYMVIKIPGKFIRYDLKSRTRRVICDHVRDVEYCAHKFIECLSTV